MVANTIAPANSHEREDLEIIDYSRVWPISEAIKTLKSFFPTDEVDIYAMGFSLGSNYLLRHLGSHENCDQICGVKAAISVSGAYELPATGITLKHSAFGIYNYFVTSMIKEHFENKKFRIQFKKSDLQAEIGQF